MSYIGNTHTRRLHHHGCRAIPTIAPKHVQPSEDGEGFPVLCKWCYAQGYHKGQVTLDDYYGGNHMKSDMEILKEYDGMKECEEEFYIEIFRKAGCVNDGINEGPILMYPHDGGVEVEGEPSKMWVFMVCAKCGYETSLVKAIQKIERMREDNGACGQTEKMP